MKRSIIAIAALLLLLSSTTYAFPPRSPRRARVVSGPVLWTAPNSVDTELSGFSQLLLVLRRAQIAQS